MNSAGRLRSGDGAPGAVQSFSALTLITGGASSNAVNASAGGKVALFDGSSVRTTGTGATALSATGSGTGSTAEVVLRDNAVLTGAVVGARNLAIDPSQWNLSRYFGGTDSATFAGTTVIPTSVAATVAQLDIGVVARVSRRGSVFATASYATNVNGAHRSVAGGEVGARWNW